jgi:SAM-dependent methyltransferase
MTYALPNAAEVARQRLAALEETYDPASFRRAEALGIGLGWRCLDVGAGGGSFARWLADRVGPSGRVVATDIDVRFLGPPLEVRESDVRTGELEPAAYDLVHTRLVLLHLPEREEVLARLAGAVRPGGLLMIEEDDVYPMLALASGAYRDAWTAFRQLTKSAGVNSQWAHELPERLDALGLVHVDAEVDTQLFRGGTAPARFWSLTWLQTRARIVEMGVPEAVVDAGRAALDDPARWYYGPARVIAWGRRPA